jgi:3-deoxy-manno-octulosonate cytidylyltransferase (CMP-KDO synthetase)
MEMYRTIIVIPARYQSTRLPGKPIVDICGKPMIYWVYQQAVKVPGIDRVFLAIDDERIAEVCRKYELPYVMTSSTHANHVLRLAEVAQKISAQYYICVNGDEPLIQSADIEAVIPKQNTPDAEPYAGYLIRPLRGISEAVDISNIKVTLKQDGTCMYMSRNLIPYPKGAEFDHYAKLIGIECFNRQALEFYARTPMGVYERTEDIDHLRFLENGIDVHMSLVSTESLSVDTPKDLENIRRLISRQLEDRNG